MNVEDRFYIDQIHNDTELAELDGWFRVIDELAGGVIAYFGRELDAINFRNARREETNER